MTVSSKRKSFKTQKQLNRFDTLLVDINKKAQGKLQVKPGGAFSVSLHYSLILVYVSRSFVLIQNHSFHSGRVVRTAFRDSDLPSDSGCLLLDLFIAEPTENMLLFKVPTL